jgi:hypothetical protein
MTRSIFAVLLGARDVALEAIDIRVARRVR